MEFEFEKYPLSLEQLKGKSIVNINLMCKDLIYEEILLYHDEEFKKKYLKAVESGENPFRDVINNANALRVLIFIST